jgi:hypothetical protein
VTTPTTALAVQIRRELAEAVAAGPSELATFPADAIQSAIDDGVITVVSGGPGRAVYALRLVDSEGMAWTWHRAGYLREDDAAPLTAAEVARDFEAVITPAALAVTR